MQPGQYLAITEHSTLGHALADVSTGEILESNPRFAVAVGRDGASLVGVTWWDLLDAVDVERARDEVRRFLAGSEATFDTVWCYIQAGGSCITGRTRLTRFEPGDGVATRLALMLDSNILPVPPPDLVQTASGESGATGSLGHADLEELVRLRTRDLVAALDEAEGANRAKNAFLRTVSHELRTPLNAIIGFSSMLTEDVDGIDQAERLRQLAFIHSSGEQLLELIEEILDITVIEAGKLVVNCEAVQLQPLLLEQQEMLRLAANGKKLGLLVVSCDDTIAVLADPRRLRQVVRNLLGNAIKFTDQGQVALVAKVLGDVVRIEVRDSGIGIAPGLRQYLFEPFHRVAQAGVAVRPGTGLGLAISKRLVEAMGGAIGYESEPGQGTRFWFVLPLAQRVVSAAII